MLRWTKEFKYLKLFFVYEENFLFGVFRRTLSISLNINIWTVPDRYTGLKRRVLRISRDLKKQLDVKKVHLGANKGSFNY